MRSSKLLLITTILSATLVLSVAACSDKSDTMTSSNARAGEHPTDANAEAGQDARDVAENFIGHINYARVALAKNKGDLAEKHIAEARNLMEQMKDTTFEQRRVDRIESGRIVYQYTTDYQYHYFPIQTGPIEVKKMGHGPVWAKNDLAVTDAQIVYLTVDLSNAKSEKRLSDAEAYITSGNLKAADIELARLTDEVVTVDEQTPIPLDKARDNIRLARNFVSAGNYAGARYALKHADNALNEMQQDDTYNVHRAAIIRMRKDVKHLQNIITQKNPTMMHKAGAKMDKWWSELKDWSDKQ